MEYVIYDFNEIIRQISGDVKGLILVNKTAATDSVVFIQDYINQNRKSIETFDANKELLDQAEDNHIDYLEANKDEAEARKKAALTKMVTGAGEIALIGLTVATAGAAAPVAKIVMFAGVGLSTLNAGANIYQGYQEYQLGSAGDTTTKTNHLILDGLFGGNEDLYLAYNVASAAMIVGGCVMSSSGAAKAGETVRLESEAVSDVSKGMKATSKIAEVEDGINAVEEK